MGEYEATQNQTNLFQCSDVTRAWPPNIEGCGAPSGCRPRAYWLMKRMGSANVTIIVCAKLLQVFKIEIGRSRLSTSHRPLQSLPQDSEATIERSGGLSNSLPFLPSRPKMSNSRCKPDMSTHPGCPFAIPAGRVQRDGIWRCKVRGLLRAADRFRNMRLWLSRESRQERFSNQRHRPHRSRWRSHRTPS